MDRRNDGDNTGLDGCSRVWFGGRGLGGQSSGRGCESIIQGVQGQVGHGDCGLVGYNIKEGNHPHV